MLKNEKKKLDEEKCSQDESKVCFHDVDVGASFNAEFLAEVFALGMG